MSVKVSCPGCAGPITFKVGSAMVAVCEFCRSVVARGDREVENLGKIADLVETDSVLAAGVKGRYRNVPFELSGRTQLRHQAGGVWDEWYAAFADGRWGWLAEAQGRFYLTFEAKGPAKAIPSFLELELGQRLRVSAHLPALTITEKGVARPISAEGEPILPARMASLLPWITGANSQCCSPAMRSRWMTWACRNGPAAMSTKAGKWPVCNFPARNAAGRWSFGHRIKPNGSSARTADPFWM